MATSPIHPDQPPIRQPRTVADRLETTVLARLYVRVVRNGPISAESISLGPQALEPVAEEHAAEVG